MPPARMPPAAAHANHAVAEVVDRIIGHSVLSLSAASTSAHAASAPDFTWRAPSPIDCRDWSSRCVAKRASPKPTCRTCCARCAWRLLEADVALPVVREFIARVKDKALGQEVVGSLNPGQALVGIVHKELAATMGEGVADLDLADAAAGGDPDGRPAGRRQDHHDGQAGHAPDRAAQEESADGLRRRLPTGRHRAAARGHRAGRRRVVPLRSRPVAGRHRTRGARPRPAPLSSTCCWSTPRAAWRSIRR